MACRILYVVKLVLKAEFMANLQNKFHSCMRVNVNGIRQRLYEKGSTNVMVSKI